MKTALEQLDRMEALVRRMAEWQRSANVRNTMCADFCDEARAIVAELPEPVDPDLIEAREICALAQHPHYSPPGAAENYRAGKFDGDTCVRRLVDALKARATK